MDSLIRTTCRTECFNLRAVSNSNKIARAYIGQFEIRHEQFAERFGWHHDARHMIDYDGLESDQFDSPATIYIVSVDTCEIPLSAMRISPITLPYMLEEESLSDLMGGYVPIDPGTVWEATRFCSNPGAPRGLVEDAISKMVVAALELGCEIGATEFLALMPTLLFRHALNRRGVETIALKSRKFGRWTWGAARIPVNRMVLSSARTATGIYMPIMDARQRSMVGLA